MKQFIGFQVCGKRNDRSILDECARINISHLVGVAGPFSNSNSNNCKKFMISMISINYKNKNRKISKCDSNICYYIGLEIGCGGYMYVLFSFSI